MFKRWAKAGSVTIIMAVLGLCPPLAGAQSSRAAQYVSVTVAPIVVMAVFGEPRPFIFDSVAGLASMSDASSYYNLTTNVDGVSISVEIDTPLPDGTRLFLSGESTLGSSRGPIDISSATAPLEIVSAIGKGLENGRRLHYEFRIEVGTGNIPLQSRTVTLSLLNPITGATSRMEQTVFFGGNQEVLSTNEG